MAGGTEPIPGTDQAKVWREVGVTVRIGEYENIHVNAGASRVVRNTAKATTRVGRQLAEALEEEVAEALERYTDIARARGDESRKRPTKGKGRR